MLDYLIRCAEWDLVVVESRRQQNAGVTAENVRHQVEMPSSRTSLMDGRAQTNLDSTG